MLQKGIERHGWLCNMIICVTNSYMKRNRLVYESSLNDCPIWMGPRHMTLNGQHFRQVMHAFCFHNTCIKQPNRQNQVVQTPSSQWVEFRDLRSHYSCITNTYTWIIITTSVFLCITSELSLKWMVWHFSFSCSSCGWLLKDGYTAHNWITSHNIIPWQAMFTWKHTYIIRRGVMRNVFDVYFSYLPLFLLSLSSTRSPEQRHRWHDVLFGVKIIRLLRSI